jgi:hypothetical protein
VNLSGAPLEIRGATVVERTVSGENRLLDPAVTITNVGPVRITSFVVAFVRGGRTTAAIQDTSSIAPGGSYTLRLPPPPSGGAQPGFTYGRAGDLVVTVLETQGADGTSWGSHTPTGVMPPTPPELRQGSDGSRPR